MNQYVHPRVYLEGIWIHLRPDISLLPIEKLLTYERRMLYAHRSFDCDHRSHNAGRIA